MPSAEQNRLAFQQAKDAGIIAPVPENTKPSSAPPQPPKFPPEINPFLRTPLPAIMGLQPDTVRQFNTSAVPQTRIPPTPPASNPSLGASGQSQATVVIQQAGGGPTLEVNGVVNAVQGTLNLKQGTGITLLADAFGGVTITGSGGDSTIHGSPFWPTDSAYFSMREDFFPVANSASTFADGNTLTTNGWALRGTAEANNINFLPMGATGTLGMPSFSLMWTNVNTSNAVCLATLCGMGSEIQGSNNQVISRYLPLLDYPDWQVSFVFKFDQWDNGSSTPAFSTAKTSFYAGLSGDTNTAVSNGIQAGQRPDTFIGIRYDTDPGTTFTLTSVANTSGGNTVYTGTITGGNIGLAGTKITVAGFTNGANNGTFTCVTATTTTITLNNPSGVAETHAATAATPAISDAFLTFEVVNNIQVGFAATWSRNNTQGTTFVTSVAPAQGVWHRVDITCTVAGKVTLTLDGSATNTLTATMPKTTSAFGPTGTATAASFNKMANITWTSSFNAPTVNFGNGSKFTVSGITDVGYTFLNGTWTYVFGTTAPTVRFETTGSVGNASITTGSMTGFPALIPFVQMGNDTQTPAPTAGAKAIFLDLYTILWNPGVLGSGTPDATKPRYW